MAGRGAKGDPPLKAWGTSCAPEKKGMDPFDTPLPQKEGVTEGEGEEGKGENPSLGVKGRPLSL